MVDVIVKADEEEAVIGGEVVSLSDDERQTCEVWTRVMGYHRPTTSFNTGKKGEFAERKPFKEPSWARASRR